MRLTQKKVGQNLVPRSKLIKFLANLSTQFDQIGIGEQCENYVFGNRTLCIYRKQGAPEINFAQSLTIETRQNMKKVPLLILDRTSALSLGIPNDLEYGPYDSILRAQTYGWVVTYNSRTRMLLALEITNMRAVFFPGDEIAPRERAEIFRPLLHWLSVLSGGVVLHAGAVAKGGKALLIAGPGNVGKTSLTQIAIEAGMDYLGDNVIEIVKVEQEYKAYGIYSTFKLRENSIKSRVLSDFPSELDKESNKTIYFSANRIPKIFESSPMEIAGILRLDGSNSKVVKVDEKRDAAFNIAPNTIGQFPYFERETLNAVLTSVRELPTYVSGFLDVQKASSQVLELLA